MLTKSQGGGKCRYLPAPFSVANGASQHYKLSVLKWKKCNTMRNDVYGSVRTDEFTTKKKPPITPRMRRLMKLCLLAVKQITKLGNHVAAITT